MRSMPSYLFTMAKIGEHLSKQLTLNINKFTLTVKSQEKVQRQVTQQRHKYTIIIAHSLEVRPFSDIDNYHNIYINMDIHPRNQIFLSQLQLRSLSFIRKTSRFAS